MGPAYKTAAELHTLLLRLITESGTTPDAICQTIGGVTGARLAATFNGTHLYTSLDIALILELIHVPTTDVFGDYPDIDAAERQVINMAREFVLAVDGYPYALSPVETQVRLVEAMHHLDEVIHR